MNDKIFQFDDTFRLKKEEITMETVAVMHSTIAYGEHENTNP